MADEPYKPRIFISYAHADEPEKLAEGEVRWLSFVTGYLNPAVKHGAVELWVDRVMPGGADWGPDIERNLRACDIFILLVSPSSLSSNYVVDKEIPIIRERQTSGDGVHFYPVLLKPTPDVALNVVRDKNLRPRDAKPLSNYTLNERFGPMNEIANEIVAIAADIARTKSALTASAQFDALKSLEFPFSNIPINVPLHFLGRDEELKAIETALKGGKGRVAALHGLRGVGKSTLAAAYAERHKAEYRATWWIRAATPDTMRADLVALGVRLGWVGTDEKEEPALAKVRDRLRHEGEGLLLVFDNAIDPGDAEPYVPAAGGAHVLVTSNSPAWGKIAEPIRIDVWKKETGADFLIARTKRIAERADAESLSNALGGLPLAHEQAAAYCDRVGSPFREYQRRFDKEPARVLDAEKDAPAEYHNKLTVAKAFALAIEEAAKLHPAAEPLIGYAALLAPEPIPLFLFAEAREKFGEPFASEIAGDGLDEAVAALRAFALVDRETIPDERDPSIATDTIRLHRLVRVAAAGRRQAQAVEAARRVLLEAMAAVYPRTVYDDPNTWPRARRLDALALGLVGDESPPLGAEQSVSYLATVLGQYRQGLGAYAQARPLFERALTTSEKALGLEHSWTATSLNNLANVLRDQGDLVGARPLFERALRIYEKTLGPDHPWTATGLNNLANVLQDQGYLASARPLYERALAIGEKVLGPDYPDTANSLNNLGRLLQDQGDLTGARSLLERALAIRRKVLGEEHPNTNITHANLASVRLDERAPSDALAMAETALAAHDKVLGANHPWTKETAGVVAGALYALGRAEEASAVRAKYGIGAGGVG